MGQQEIAALQNFNPAYESSAVSLDRPKATRWLDHCAPAS
jgi:hypothetical protein